MFATQWIDAWGDRYTIPHDVLISYGTPVSKHVMYPTNIYPYYAPTTIKLFKIKMCILVDTLGEIFYRHMSVLTGLWG